MVVTRNLPKSAGISAFTQPLRRANSPVRINHPILSIVLIWADNKVCEVFQGGPLGRQRARRWDADVLRALDVGPP
jgi:hypothetical protein